tara:strand:+ start:155 stop:823 length:669 start_codon:yes stop_codon:yes gene_type:complete
MEIKKITLNILFILSISFAYEKLDYKIKYLGLYVANCEIKNKEIIYDDKLANEIVFNVETRKFFDIIFPINNEYKIILDNNNQILQFSKKTNQPGVYNDLMTKKINNKIYYIGSSFEIKKEYFNIFSFLHFIMNSETIPSNLIIEREGIIYDAFIKYDKKDSAYILDLVYKNFNNPIINKTDVFTWALFMEDAKRKFYINDKKIITKCVFRKGLITVTADLK